MAERTAGERIVALEASYEHVATKADIANLRAELKGDIASLRAELKGDIANFRTELKDDIASSKGELKGDIASVRDELKGDIGSLRTDFVSFQSEIRGAVRTMLRILVIAISILGILVSLIIYFLSRGGI